MTSIRERNKELILRAASEEFADKGFAATKTSDIAAKAGLPKPNVYYYFKSKENLYREVLESIIEPLLEKLRHEGMQLSGPHPADTLFTPRQLAIAEERLRSHGWLSPDAASAH